MPPITRTSGEETATVTQAPALHAVTNTTPTGSLTSSTETTPSFLPFDLGYYATAEPPWSP